VLGVGVAWAPRTALADDPVVPGFTVEVYATVTNPNGLDFDADGNLFTGRHDPNNPTGDDLLSLHTIAPGGSPAVEFGPALPDADGVVVDLDGSITGTAGAAISGGRGHFTLNGQLAAVLPDGTLMTLHPPTTNLLGNPNYLARGRDGLLFTDSAKTKVFEFVAPGPPTVLIDSPSGPVFIVVDSTHRIFVSHTDGILRIWDADGVLVDGSFANGARHDRSRARVRQRRGVRNRPLRAQPRLRRTEPHRTRRDQDRGRNRIPHGSECHTRHRLRARRRAVRRHRRGHREASRANCPSVGDPASGSATSLRARASASHSGAGLRLDPRR
jgi:hypothetical protein